MAAYCVGPDGPPRQLESCAALTSPTETARRVCSTARFRPTIVVSAALAASRTRSTVVAPPAFGHLHWTGVMSMRFVVFARTVHLHGFAAVGAILLCFAVVLNVGPFAKAPAAVGRQAALVTMEQPNESGMAQRDLDAHTHTRATDIASVPLQPSQSAERSDELPEGIRALIQPSPFLVADASPVLQPFVKRHPELPPLRHEELPPGS